MVAGAIGRIFGAELGNVIQNVIRTSGQQKEISSANFDPITLIQSWPVGLVQALLEAVCSDPFSREPATLHKKGIRVLTALEVLANARSQKHTVLQRFLSDVGIPKRQKFTIYRRFCVAMLLSPKRSCTSLAHARHQEHQQDTFDRILRS